MRDRSSGVVGPWPITHRLELETEKKFNGACCLGPLWVPLWYSQIAKLRQTNRHQSCARGYVAND